MITHFAPYGATHATCEVMVPRRILWNPAAGEYNDLRFTTRVIRVTCPDCLRRLDSRSAVLVPESAVDAALDSWFAEAFQGAPVELRERVRATTRERMRATLEAAARAS